MSVLIVLPSFNERDNIVRLIDSILSQGQQYLVCVVDDSSPDGTHRLVQQNIENKPHWTDRVHLIVRQKKDGRGGAVRDGFSWGIRSHKAVEAFVEMDCDFSHDPVALPKGIRLLSDDHDVVIGARYPDGTIEGWPMSRRVFSFFANSLARLLIDRKIADFTNGFRFYSPGAVQILIDRPQRFKGYIYLSESLSYLLRSGMRVASFPIYFKNRERGVSNTTLSEIGSALRGLISIAWEHHRSKP
jgi:dolichol-phosphate mannosyltransferase